MKIYLLKIFDSYFGLRYYPPLIIEIFLFFFLICMVLPTNVTSSGLKSGVQQTQSIPSVYKSIIPSLRPGLVTTLAPLCFFSGLPTSQLVS